MSARRPVDPLVRELEKELRPLIAPAREKAEMLVARLAELHGFETGSEPTGLAEAVRQLKVHLSEDDIRSGAQALIADLSAAHGRETVT